MSANDGENAGDASDATEASDIADASDVAEPSDVAELLEAAEASEAGRTKTGAGLPASALLLLAALAAGTRVQGGFYATGQLLIAALVAASVVTAFVGKSGRRVRRAELGWPAVFAVAFAGWAIISAVAGHHPRAAIPVVGLVAGLIATALVVARLSAPQRLWLADAVILIGVAAGMSGWFGVVAHATPLAHADQGLWRAATTLTYANAAAGLLVPLALLSLARAAESKSRREAMMRAAAVTALFVGIASTFSRGGAIAFVAGLVVLAVVRQRRAIAKAAVGPLLGACVGMAGLLTSVPEQSHTHPFLAMAALFAGLGCASSVAALLYGPGRSRGAPDGESRPSRDGESRPAWQRRTTTAVAIMGGLGIVVAALAVAISSPVRHAATTIAHPRLTATSDDRVGESTAAIREIGRHPILGSGPGTQLLHWSVGDGEVFFDHYAHDEYLQVAWKLGVPGLVLLIAMLGAFGIRVKRGRQRPATPGLWSGALAGLCGLAVGSSLDFLWHIPLIPLIGMVLVGFSTTTEENYP